MKKLFTAVALVCVASAAFAGSASTKTDDCNVAGRFCYPYYGGSR